MKAYYQLTKPGIVKLVVLTGAAGYLLGFRHETNFSLLQMALFLIGLALLSGGSLALNQVQEWRQDAKMPRTSLRPIPQGQISPISGFLFSSILIFIGLLILISIQPMTFFLGLFTLIFYNLIYTIILKKHVVFAAVPGAVPGAAPSVLGYSAIHPNIYNSEVLYIFLLMFLWQMPHFWALAIRYAEDYKQGGFPVLPAQLGQKRTKIHMALYLLPYVTLSLTSPWFVETHYFYYFLVIPVSLVVVYEFYRFCVSKDQRAWLRFFIWINISILIFLITPVLDKWVYYFEKYGRYGQ